MIQAPGGFREIEHTADWEIEVWAADLSGLLEQAARGMYSLTDTRLESDKRLRRHVEVPFHDRESLLEGFLSELLYLGEVEGLGFDMFDLKLEGGQLKADLEGAPLRSQSKQIKAVTYHNMRVREGPRGFEANIVFDV